MKKIFITFLVFFSTLSFAQNEASNWYFGQNAGLKFDARTGTVTTITDGQINTLEGCTSISDTDGNLLFYTDGRTVWNQNHQIMPNGDYYGGTGLLGDPSSTSSGLIVPKPRDLTKYYIFTVDEPHHNNAAVYPNQNTTVPTNQDDGFNNGFNYSLVDMTLNGGLGGVDTIEKNIHLITYDASNTEAIKYKCSEKITAVKAEDCTSFWVITHFADTFYAFKVNENGVSNTPVTSTVGPNIPIEGYRRNALGYLKASPDGTKLISANFGESRITAQDAGGGIYLFDFNSETGIVSNDIELYSPQNNDSPYGVEFSSENRKVYATINIGISGNGQSQILQWDLESADISNSLQIIHTSNSLSAGALQLGIDKKIYRAQVDFSNLNNTGRFLGVINNPEADGLAINYNEQGILLDINGGSNNLSRIGLPPFIQSLFNTQIDIVQNGISITELKLCTGDSYTLQATDIQDADYFWTFDGNPLSETSFQLFVDTPGFYEVYIEPNNGKCPIVGSAVVGIYDIPVAHQPTNVSVCGNAGNDDIFSFDFTNKTPEALQMQDPTKYNVRYFESLDNANNLKDEITFPYPNSSNPQTIYVRVDNIENTNCFAINSFEVEVFNIPQIVKVNDIEVCDNEADTMDGITTIDLSDLISDIIGNQEEAGVNVSFHSSQGHADDNIDTLPLMHTNSNPFNETLFVRIENVANDMCYSTSSFNLTINRAPLANNTILLQCDEDDISEGITIFNLDQATADITGGATDVSIAFYTSQNDAENENNEVNNNAFENDINPQTIYTRVTNTNTGCVSISEISLEVSTTTSNNISMQACDDDGVEDGFTSFNLANANTIIPAGAPDGLTLQYYETYPDALVETNPLNNTYTNTIAYNQTIYARVENNNACFGISEIDLTVFQLPNVETEYQTLYCLNDFPKTITLNAGIINDSPSNYFYQWSTGETTDKIEVNTPGTYTVKITNPNGCFKDRTITILPSNIATITNIEIIDASQNNSISIIVSGEGDYQYALNNSDGPYQDSPIFNNLLSGIYTVYVKDKNNCGIVKQLVSVVGFPKFFTPNDDGKHDFWQIYGASTQFQTNTTIYIFDRYGKLLKELNPFGIGWDGTYNGAKLPASDYWFKVTLEDGRTFTSHFALKR